MNSSLVAGEKVAGSRYPVETQLLLFEEAVVSIILARSPFVCRQTRVDIWIESRAEAQSSENASDNAHSQHSAFIV